MSHELEYRQVDVHGKRFAVGDWEVHFSDEDRESATYGTGWVRNRATLHLRRFGVFNGRLRWFSEFEGLQLVGPRGPITYRPIVDLTKVAPIVVDLLINAFDAEIL